MMQGAVKKASGLQGRTERLGISRTLLDMWQDWTHSVGMSMGKLTMWMRTMQQAPESETDDEVGGVWIVGNVEELEDEEVRDGFSEVGAGQRDGFNKIREDRGDGFSKILSRSG